MQSGPSFCVVNRLPLETHSEKRAERIWNGSESETPCAGRMNAGVSGSRVAGRGVFGSTSGLGAWWGATAGPSDS